MRTYDACPYDGRRPIKSRFSNWFWIFECRECGTEYCAHDGPPCPECGEEEYDHVGKCYYDAEYDGGEEGDDAVEDEESEEGEESEGESPEHD